MDACIYDRFSPCEHSCDNCVQCEETDECDCFDFLYKFIREEKLLEKYEENGGNDN